MLTKNEFVEEMSKMLYKPVTYEQIINTSSVVKSDEKKNGNSLHTKYHYLFVNYIMNKVIYFQEDTIAELEMGDLNEESTLGFTILDSFSFF